MGKKGLSNSNVACRLPVNSMDINILIHEVPPSVSGGERDALNKRIFTSVSRLLLATKRFAAAI